MADVVASLLVRIDAEDNASAVLAKLSDSVGSLGGAGAAGTKSVKGLNAEMNAGKSAAEAYKSKMEAAAKATLEKKTALEAAKAAYKGETAEANKNTAQLAKQKQSVESLIRTKRNEISALEQSNSIINKGSQAYKDNCKAIQWTKTELDSLEKQHKSITDSISANEAAVLKSSKAYKTAQEEVEAAEAAYSKYSKSDLDVIEKNERAAASLKRWQDAGAGLKTVGEGLDAVTKPLQYAAVGAVAGGAAVSAAAMKYETAFTGVKKTVDGTPEQLQQVNTEIRAMSENIPVSAAELANLAAVGGQLGVGIGDISKFTEVMAAMGVATNLSGEEGAASMARFLNVMGENVSNIDRAGSAIVALGNNTATTEADIASMAVRMGKYGKTVGMNTQQVLGYSAALSSMGIEAQVGGSAIGRTWLDIETAVNSGGDTLNAYAKYAGVSAHEFAKQWSTDPSGAFNGLIKGLSSVENLTDAMLEMGIVNTQDQQVVMALANGYDMLTKCLDLSGTAYKENTALMKEANAAYGTTANQIQLTKNAVTDAAISWGEVLLPEIRSGAQYVGGLADKFGSLDDNTKKTLVSGAKAAVVLGAASKATVGAIKGVGNVVDGVSKIKTAFAVGGAFAKFAPALASIASAAGPAALGIAGVTTAVVAVKKAYDHWYDSKYKFAEGLKGETENLKQSYDAWKNLNDLQWEYNDLSGKISNGELAGKELEEAKSRLEEIKNILKEKYKIDLDSGDIDGAIEKAKELSKLDFYNGKNKLQNDINDLQEPYEKAIKNLPELQTQYNMAKEKADSYNRTLLKLAEARDKFNNGAADSIAYTKEFAAALNELGKKTGDGDTYGDRLLKEYEKLYGKGNTDNLYGFAALQLSSRISELDIEGLSEKISQYTHNIDLYKEAVKGLADINVLQLGEAIKSGGDTEQYISAIKKYIDAGVLSADEYSKKIAQIQTGFSGIEQAMKGNDLTGYLNTYISDMREFGQSTEQVASGIGNMLSGIDFSKLDTSQLQQIQTALSKLKGMENIKINVNADGDVSIIDEATGKVQILQASGNVSIDIQENGDIHVLNEAGEVIEKLKANQNVSLQVAAKADGTQDLESVNKITEALKQNGNVEVTVTANDDGSTTISTIQNDIDNLKQNSNVDVTVTAKANTKTNSGNILTGIKDFLFPTAAAAEIEVPVTAKAGEVDASSITADVIDKVNGTEIPDTATKTLGIVVEPGNIDVSAVNSAVESSVGQIAQGNTSIDVTVTATTAGLDAVQALSTAITNVSGKTVSAKAEVTGKSDVDDLRESINLLRGKTVDVAANVRGISDVKALKDAIDSVKSKTVTVKAVTKEVKQNAKGTQNFSGGLAMVNDQKGISDPRELIIDRGRAFIPEGRNVILSLSKGAKVYTASQTKAIMSSMGIPHYAEGKDNSDAFKAARDAWTHTTRIRALTVTEELEKWVELSGKFKGNIKDAEDIEEEIFTSVRALRDELNEQSEDYILERAELNDWGSWGDTAVSAFDRVRERENKYVAEGKITAKEADSYLVDLGENMYDARIANSKAWLEHEEKYNNMAVENYIAGLDRMAAYTNEYYAKGIITAKEYRISMQEISDLKADKIKEANNAEYEAWKKDAAQYRKRAENYGWGFDSELEYLERYRAKIKKFYDDGKISFEEYIYDYQDAQMEWYQKQSDTYDAMLRNAEKYVDTIEENQNQAKDAFEDKWNMAKLDDNIKEQTELVKLYNGAVTARGKEALKTANDKLADYRHEKAAYELEQQQAAELERLRRDYNRLEIGKKTYLAAISGSTEAAERYIKALNKIPEDMRYIMGELLTAIRNIKVQGGNTSTYGDTHYNIQMPNIEGNFINKLNRALGGY